MTNLCRARKVVPVDRGVITETGPQIPVSLGFSCGESGDWEEILDEDGEPTGIERSFKLNVMDGSTESIDDEWDRLRRENGLSDGINWTRQVIEEYAVQDDSESESGDGYQADVSDRESSQLSTEYEIDSSTTDDLGRTRTTLSDPQCGESDRNALGGRRTTLRSHERGCTTDALDRIHTTLSSCSSESQSAQRSLDDSNDQIRARENQGIREVCVAAQGGGTWVALHDSKDSELDNSEQGDNEMIYETLNEELDEASMNGEDAKENEVDSNDRIHGGGPNSHMRQL